MFRYSLVLACMAAAAEAFTPAVMPLTTSSARRSTTNSQLRMQASDVVVRGNNRVVKANDLVLTKELFTKLDVDGSGEIDMKELQDVLGNRKEVQDLMARADLNGDGVMDYAEYERLMNMQRFSEEQGGNLYVRNAIKLGLLKEGSVLEDCVMVGNKGFDPLNCATSAAQLDQYREAELKHGRLAMLAALGWPVSELLQPYLSKIAGLPDLLAAGEKAPSILNGGLDKINPAFFMGIIIFTATVESIALNAAPRADSKPGDLGFDPLRLYTGKTEDVKRDLELKELNNGRLAMLAITAFAIQEWATKAPVA